MWPFTHASSSRNIPVATGENAQCNLRSYSINAVATSAEREQIGEQLLGRRSFDTCHPGRRLARLQLAALAPGYTNG